MNSAQAAEAYQSKTRDTRRPQSAVSTRAIHFEVPTARKPSPGRSFRETDEDGSVDDFIQDDSPVHSDGVGDGDADVDDTIDKLYQEHKHSQFVRSLEHSPVSEPSAQSRRNRPGSPHSSKSRDTGGYLSSSSGDYEHRRIDYMPEKPKASESKEDNLYKYISNLMTDKPTKPKRASSASVSRPLSGKVAVEDSSAQNAASTKSSGLSRRPLSAATTRSRPASGYTYKSSTSKVTESPAIGSVVSEITSLEAKIYESNSQKKIREANEFSKDLNLKFTWELTTRATTQTPYRVILKSNGKFVREMSMDMFNREFKKLQRDRQDMFRERKNKVMEGQFRALFDRDPEENARETRSTIKELLLETMQLISKLQEQTELIRRKNESKFPRGGIFLNS